MKRKSLITTIVFSILLAVVVIAVTVYSVLPRSNNNAGNNTTNVSDEKTDPAPVEQKATGTEEDPYIISSTDDFFTYVVGKYTDDEGKYIDYNAKDEEGNLVNAELNNGLYFKLDADVDMSSKQFTTIFNKGIAFNGHIDGNGHTISNVNVNVTKENFADFVYEVKDGLFVAHVGIFGEIKDATIVNVSFENVNVTVADDVFDYIQNVESTINEDLGGYVYELTVGSLAGIAKDSQIEVKAQSTIVGGAYTLIKDEKAQGQNAIGGLVGVIDGTKIENSEVNANITVNHGVGTYVAGVAGKAYDAELNNSKVELNANVKYDERTYVAGAIAYAYALDADTVQSTLNVSQIATDKEFDVKTAKDVSDEITLVAGFVNRIRTFGLDENETAEDVKSNLNKITVNTNVDADVVYAGLVMDIVSSKESSEKLVSISNAIVNSNVKTLKAYGFARQLENAIVTFEDFALDMDNDAAEYNIRLVGSVKFATKIKDKVVAAKMFAQNIDDNTNTCDYSSLKVIVSNEIATQFDLMDNARRNVVASYETV